MLSQIAHYQHFVVNNSMIVILLFYCVDSKVSLSNKLGCFI